MTSVQQRQTPQTPQSPQPVNLADLLERVLDKGIVIAGDIRVSLVDVELLTVKIRLLVASVDRAAEMGIDWWQHDPALSSRARDDKALEEENRQLREQIAELRGDDRRVEEPAEDARNG